ncbi:nucleolar and coiled-body phosphoprotein 1 [Drosophila obscura]|uniref:nucleolar and coiled-body phosphoprotein 1 n=1 Tax=Drosophila obscura TaxID=7282 RepID=UPI001BB25742|nr:nucleolar and coiled-body phosphoprotein 1 [Drosophila obscura]
MMLAAAGLPAYDAGKLNSNPSNGTGGGSVGTPSAVGASRPSAASALMKTLSVRLHRGTEFIKDTVQKALVMSAPAPVAEAPAPAAAPPPPAVGSAGTPSKPVTLTSQTLKRKLAGAGGLMGCGPSRITSITASSSSGRFILAHANRKPASQVPTEAFLKVYTVAPTELHRSAAARVRNPSTDSLLMDLCQFKPIRPMPITPIKINKFRGFELKRPKFVPAVNDSEDEDDDEDDPESIQKPKPSSVTLLPHKGSAFVPMPYIESPNTTAAAAITAIATRSRSRSHNTHTSATGADEPKPKRRRRAPLLTARRRRTRTSAATAAAASGAPSPVNNPSASPEEEALKPAAPGKRKAATKSGPAKRSRAAAANPTPVAAPSTSPEEAAKAPAKRKSSTKREPAKRSRAAASAAANPTPVTASTSPGRAPRAPAKRKSAPAKGPAKRSCGGSSSARPSPPMTRQRARQQISASSCHSGST